MNYLLYDKNDSILPLFTEDQFFKIKASPLNIRSSILERYQQSGGIIQGDLKSPVRELEFIFNILAEDDANFRYGLNKIASFFRKENRPYYLADTENSIKTEVYIRNLDPNWNPGLEFRVMDCSLTLSQLDAKWEDITETTRTQTMIPDGIMTININPVCDETFFKAKFTGAGSNIRFALNNLSNGGSFLIENLAFDEDDVIIVDGRGKGSITYNGALTKRIMSGGIYFPLSPGENRIQYQSQYGNVGLEITYSQKYPY